MPYHCHNTHELTTESDWTVTLTNFPFERILKTRKDGDTLHAYIQSRPIEAGCIVCLGWVPKADIEYVDSYAAANS